MKIIAETAFHHEGDFVFMSDLIDQLCASQADVIKVHLLLDLDSYMTKSHPLYDALSRFLFTKEQWTFILNKIKESGKELMVLVNDVASVEFSTKFQPELIELHSVALNDKHLIDAVNQYASKDIQVVLGVGGSRLEEVENAATNFSPEQVVLMFGFQNYPTRYQDVNLKKTRRIMNAFPEYIFGYADHTAWDSEYNELITLLGAAQGVQYIEKHVTTDYGAKRTDSAAAISTDMLESLVQKVKILEALLGDGKLALNEAEKKYCIPGNMKKAAVLSKDVKKGESLSFDNIVFSRAPSTDMSQLDVWEAQGSHFTEDLNVGTVLFRKHLGL